MAFIHSKASTDIDFNLYGDAKSTIAHVRDKVTVKGGANVMDHERLYVPEGAVTEVNDKELELLKQNPAFMRMIDRKVYKITNDHKLDTKGLIDKDGCAQMDDADHASKSRTTAFTELRNTQGERGKFAENPN